MCEVDAKGDGDNLGSGTGDTEAGYCVQDSVGADVAACAMGGSTTGVKTVTKADMAANGSRGGC